MWQLWLKCCCPCVQPLSELSTATMRALSGRSCSLTTRNVSHPCSASSRAVAALPASTKAACTAAKRVSELAALHSRVPAKVPRVSPSAHSSSKGSSSRHQVMAAAASSSAAGQQQPETSFVPLSELKELCSKALSTIGYTQSEIAVLLEVRMPCPFTTTLV